MTRTRTHITEGFRCISGFCRVPGNTWKRLSLVGGDIVGPYAKEQSVA